MANRPMPTKLKVLLGVMAFGVLLNLAHGLMGSGTSWASAALGALLAFGVLRGSEGVRTLLIGLAALGLLFGGLGFLGGLALAATGTLAGITILMASLINVGQNGYMIWCLRQQDVQHWMFNKSLTGVDGA